MVRSGPAVQVEIRLHSRSALAASAGHKLNRLLTVSSLGATKLSSYHLPSSDFTHGRASVPEPVPVSDLVAHRYTRSAVHAAPVPDHPAAAPSVRPPPPA